MERETGYERDTGYERWIRGEGIPILEGFGVEDFSQVELAPWERTGGKGAFFQLKGMEGFTGMYMGEIAPGKSLKPERHLYDKLIYILRGRGATEVGWGSADGRKVTFEWEEGAIFAVPLNSVHRMFNGSSQPVRYLAVTSAPILIDLLHEPEFIFGCDYTFDGRFDAASNFFVPTDKRIAPKGGFWVWETNFVPDVRAAKIDPAESKGAGVQLSCLQMSASALVGHIAQWPVGRYHKAHHHQGGAIILIVQSKGYTLMWPKDAGSRPYKAGRGQDVVKVDWKVGSFFCPPTGWYHQHFNTGSEPARQLAFRYNSHSGEYRLGIGKALNLAGVNLSTRKGGTLIEYEDEDPQIRIDYEQEIRAGGVVPQMPAFSYRED
ncbi:MAG: cupin domain-containing protein [Desulfobacterales bacterium]|nr:cupin domain-containing protein [Desulfobacterales bacterium]